MILMAVLSALLVHAGAMASSQRLGAASSLPAGPNLQAGDHRARPGDVIELSPATVATIHERKRRRADPGNDGRGADSSFTMP